MVHDHFKTVLELLQIPLGDLTAPKNFVPDQKLNSVNDLADLIADFDLFLLDRDCTLQSYHGTRRPPEFENTLRMIASKSEIVSNSSYDELRRIRDMYGDLMPISKLVKFESDPAELYVLRFMDGNLHVLRWEKSGEFCDVTSHYSGPNEKIPKISCDYRKPQPIVIQSVVNMNRFFKRVPPDPRVAMVGDKYLTDVLCGRLAGVFTLKVMPYEPSSEPLSLRLGRRVDAAVGALMRQM